MKENKEDKAKRERNAQILSDFKDKKARYSDFWDPIYKDCEKHRRFTLLGKQLEDSDWKAMGVVKPLEPNLLLTYANHEANKTLQTDYKAKVTPNGGGANEVMARARQDVMRGLQRTGNVTQVYNKARRDQVCGGVAYSIVKLGYAGKRGFGKTIKYEYLDNYQNVYPDMEVQTPTFSDMRDCLIKRDVPRNQWEEETGNKPDWPKGQKTKELWYYWVREDVKDTEYLVGDAGVLGSSLPMKGKEPDLSTVMMDEMGEPLSRPVEDYTWCWYKIAEDKVLDDEDWRGSYPPIIACTGRKVVSQGKITYQPLTQFAEEAQKVYTIIENIIGMRLSRSPFSKWKIAIESLDIKAISDLRKASITGDFDILYKSLDASGKPIPIPEEVEPYVLDPLLIELQREQKRKIQEIFGIYDANLGQKSNEQSGVAIRERAQGGELSNFDLQVNYMEYVEQNGRVTLDLIPKVLTAPQQIAFVDEEDKTVLGWINTTGGISFSPDEEYNLSIEAMPISQTAREDEAQALMDMAEKIPLIANNPQAAALIVKSQPGRYSGQIAEILQGVNPELEEAKAAIGELQGQLQQAEQQKAQDDMAQQALKNALAGMKMQMTLLKQMQAMENQTDMVKAQNETMQAELDTQIKAIELQIKQEELEIKKQDANTREMAAKGGVLKSMADANRPDPKPKAAE